VLERAMPYLCTHWANPHATHRLARRPAAAVEEAREEVAAWAGVRARDVIFTSGATESNHLAIRGVQREDRPRLLVSAVEHPSLAVPAADLNAQVLAVDSNGVLDLAALEAALAEDVGLVCVMAANNETGVVQPLAEVHALCRAVGAWLHVDAAQVAGRFAVPPHWDLLTLSSHKAGGLKGAGALVFRQGIAVVPQMVGGSQERGRRAGTVDVPAVVGLAEVLHHPWPAADLRGWRDSLAELAEAAGCTVTAGQADRLPNTLHLCLDGIAGETLAMSLDLEGVCASTGSACASGAAEPSVVMAAMGRDPRSGLRLSLGWSTTGEEVERAGQILQQVVERCLNMEAVG
jgi:cysteine desulfurase